MEKVDKVTTLLVVSHVVHYAWKGGMFAYGPYSREIDVWAELFPQVLIASPLRRVRPPGDAVAFVHSNIAVCEQLETGGNNFYAKVMQVTALPMHVWRLSRAMLRADAIHVRCPGNLGLLGAILAPLFSRRLVAKYAGQWNGYPGERLAVCVQRGILSSRWWRGPVLVYGKWPNQPQHVLPFFTAMMTRKMVDEAGLHARGKRIGKPLKLLFVGRLAPEKRIDALIEAAAILQDRSVPFLLAIVGGGPEEMRLRKQVEHHRMSELVTFTGALSYQDGLKWMAWGECLVLPSQHSEGWPKVITEAMCYGLLCFGVRHGLVADMLSGRGVVLERGEPDEIAAKVQWATENAESAEILAHAGTAWAARYSLDGFRTELAKLLEQHWSVSLHLREERSPS